jgi:ammonium transporter, Amt family
MSRAAVVRRLLFGAIIAFTLTAAFPRVVLFAQSAAASAPVGDPTGALTGTAKDVVVKDPANPTLSEVMDPVGHNKVAINMVWMLICGFLVMFMQAGFAAVETGFTRAKNVAHTMTMNFMIYPIGMIGYWICGYALQMGGVGGVAALGGNPFLMSEVRITLFGSRWWMRSSAIACRPRPRSRPSTCPRWARWATPTS